MSAPVRRLGATYFVYFAIVGIVAPYLPVYLASLDFDYDTVGLLTSIVLGTKVFAPMFWGHLADRSGRYVFWVRMGALAALTISLFLPGARAFFWVAVALFGYSFFWNAILPQMEVITLNALGAARQRYSRIRLWGSVGFIAAVSLIGVALDYLSVALLPWALVVCLASLLLLTFTLPDRTGRGQPVSTRRFLRVALSRTIWPFWIMVFLLQWSFGAYYVFFSLTLERAGYSFATTGMLWSLGVVAEIILFAAMPGLLKRFTLYQLFGMALCLTIIRWSVTGWLTDSPVIITVAQLGHAFSFGVMHACSIEFLHRTFSGKGEGLAQSAYSALSFGLGGAVGATTSGFLFERFGPEVTFSVAALLAGLALLPLLSPLRQRLQSRG
ncbi:MAG: MFS transporter [Gammaproteobacteria bacterium]|nr:MAG: MFS transporter [Gammaproteobacteria bacterium]